MLCIALSVCTVTYNSPNHSGSSRFSGPPFADEEMEAQRGSFSLWSSMTWRSAT